MLNNSYKKAIVNANGNKYESYKTIQYVHESPTSENSSNLQINTNKAIMTINSLELTGGATATTEDIVVTRSGKNLFDYDNVNFQRQNPVFIDPIVTKINNGFKFACTTATRFAYTTNISAFHLKPKTTYTSRAIVTLINNGSSDIWEAGSMGMSLLLQTNNNFDGSGKGKVYIVDGYTNYKGVSVGTHEIITTFTTPADMTDFKYVVTRVANRTTVIFQDLQIELGDTSSDYEPYLPPKSLTFSRDYLLSLKGVNNLLDKSKFPATQTINGVTFTNNGDGTITANGTATANAVFSPINITNSISIVSGHKFLFISCPPGGGFSTYYSDLKKVPEDEAFFDVGVGVVMTTTSTTTGLRFNIRIISGYTANNLVFKPQLYDLTAIYGEGNEPTTVEQFLKTYPLSSTDKLTITKNSVKYNNTDITSEVTGLDEFFIKTGTNKAIIDTNYIMGSISADVKKLFVSYKKSAYQADK